MKAQAAEVDTRNRDFWNELCGSHLARCLGINQVTPENLRRFDEAFLAFYPYLPRYFEKEALQGRKVLEIGLGYGTLGQALTARGRDYFGLDIAEDPVAMMSYRLDKPGKSEFGLARRSTSLTLTLPSITSTRSAASITPATCERRSPRFTAC